MVDFLSPDDSIGPELSAADTLGPPDNDAFPEVALFILTLPLGVQLFMSFDTKVWKLKTHTNFV